MARMLVPRLSDSISSVPFSSFKRSRIPARPTPVSELTSRSRFNRSVGMPRPQSRISSITVSDWYSNVQLRRLGFRFIALAQSSAQALLAAPNHVTRGNSPVHAIGLGYVLWTEVHLDPFPLH
jgi:hypothetical protein